MASIVEMMLSQINGYGRNKSYEDTYQINNTEFLTEEWNRRFEKKNKHCFNSEEKDFNLYTKTQYQIMKSQNRIILGGPRRKQQD